MVGYSRRPHPMWVREPDAPEGTPWTRTTGYGTSTAEPDPYEGLDKVFQGQKAIDVLGNEIHVGDRIAVAVTVDRSANMRIGTVTAISEILAEDWSVDAVPGKAIPKKGSGNYRIKCEWEASGWESHVKSSSVEAGLPKYIKLY